MEIKYSQNQVFTQAGVLVSTTYVKETYDDSGQLISVEVVDSIPT